MKPIVGVLCCNEMTDRPIQAVASRFIEPLSCVAGATVLLVPALADVMDAAALARRLDGLLLTGSRSNVAADRYGGINSPGRLDRERDEVAFALAGRMIEAGRPVFGICRGLQELNVLFGGTLSADLQPGSHYHPDPDLPFDALFGHTHDVAFTEGGLLSRATGHSMLNVNSVHHQGIERLGADLTVEAISTGDGLIEGFSTSSCDAPVLAVQWHPEWDGASCPSGFAFFSLFGQALRGEMSTSLRQVA